MLKIMFQSLVIWLGGTFVYKKSPLNDKVVDSLIKADKSLKEGKKSKKLARKRVILFDYIAKYRLKPYQVTNILKEAHSKELIQKIVRNYELSEEQETLLLSLENNILLLETYLAPDGYLDPNKKLSLKAEEQYVISMLTSHAKIGLELFKTYVDNTKRTILTDNILKTAIENDCFASRYLLNRAFFNEEQELYLVETLDEEGIEDYIELKQLYYEKSQALLVEKYFTLAKLHHAKYGFRPKVMPDFREKKKKELEELHPMEAIP